MIAGTENIRTTLRDGSKYGMNGAIRQIGR